MPDEQPHDHPYPRHWEADVVASDGGIVHLRPILPADSDDLLAFHSKLSDRTRYLRYFGPYPRISARDLERFTVVDHRTRVAFLALLGDEIVAVDDAGPILNPLLYDGQRHGGIAQGIAQALLPPPAMSVLSSLILKEEPLNMLFASFFLHLIMKQSMKLSSSA